MGRGKVEIKKIENATNRQVTFSKRRNGIFKKAQELTVLCDAKVSLIMFSHSGRFHEFISPSTTTKQIIDKYQKISETDLWITQYERMQNELKELRGINNNLRRDIEQRMGKDLNELEIDELRSLEQRMTSAVDMIRERKYHMIKTQTQTYNKKVKNLEARYGDLLLDFAKCEDPDYGLVDDGGDYESAIALANGTSNLYSLRLHHGHPTPPNLHHVGGFGPHELRLA